MLELKNYFHKNPEISHKEFNTSKVIKKIIGDKLTIENTTNTGFLAILDTGREGKTVGIRTELDALPIQESITNLKKDKEVISNNEGIMHACGHDGHMAIVLTCMKILSEIKNDLKGKYIFIFEEAEETGGSINQLIPMLEKYDFDLIYGNHLCSNIETGLVSINDGPVMAGSAKISFKVLGEGGHASRPDETINPIYAATTIINSIGMAWNYRRDITETVTLGISKFISGSTWNVISDEALIEGTLRFFNMDEGKKCIDLIKSIAKNTSQGLGAKVVFDKSANKAFSPTINESKLTHILNSIVEKNMSNIKNINYQWFASETFAEYSKLCPTIFPLIGSKNLNDGKGAAHHNEKFELDNESLLIALEILVRFIMEIQ